MCTVACAVLFLVVKWGYEWPSKFVHYDVWFKDSAVLYEKVEEGYLHDGENIEADLLNEEEDKKLSLARLYLEKEIYVERFFKNFSKFLNLDIEIFLLNQNPLKIFMNFLEGVKLP